MVAKPWRKMKVSLAASDVKLLAASFTTSVLDTWLVAAPVAGSMAAAVTAKRPETEPAARPPVGVSAGRASATLAVPPAPSVTSTKRRVLQDRVAFVAAERDVHADAADLGDGQAHGLAGRAGYFDHDVVAGAAARPH